MLTLQVEVSAGEVIDKISILRIKREKISDPAKLQHVVAELESLDEVWANSVPDSVELAELTASLQTVNEQLWDIEDEIRLCEQQQNFGNRFVELARSVYEMNDRQAELKKQINVLLGSRHVEEKHYPDWRTSSEPTDYSDQGSEH